MTIASKVLTKEEFNANSDQLRYVGVELANGKYNQLVSSKESKTPLAYPVDIDELPDSVLWVEEDGSTVPQISEGRWYPSPVVWAESFIKSWNVPSDIAFDREGVINYDSMANVRSPNGSNARYGYTNIAPTQYNPVALVDWYIKRVLFNSNVYYNSEDPKQTMIIVEDDLNGLGKEAMHSLLRKSFIQYTYYKNHFTIQHTSWNKAAVSHAALGEFVYCGRQIQYNICD